MNTFIFQSKNFEKISVRVPDTINSISPSLKIESKSKKVRKERYDKISPETK